MAGPRKLDIQLEENQWPDCRLLTRSFSLLPLFWVAPPDEASSMVETLLKRVLGGADGALSTTLVGSQASCPSAEPKHGKTQSDNDN